MPILVIERGDEKGEKLKVEPAHTYLFGRDPNISALPLSDTLASRRHFEIDTHGPQITIRDLSSTNGTFVNDEQIRTAELKIGDKIQVGDLIMSLLSDEGFETPAGLVGKSIGGYRIIERVGRGGMGTVYKSTQLSLNRLVALKVLSAKLLKDNKFIEKFKSEARSAGQLNHPNIVQVYDVGTDRNLHFFSMEFMDGGSLQDKIGSEGKLTWEETLDVLTQATRALIFAERKEIVHRDVKPDNLMLTSDGQIKLADLGLARRTGQDQAAEEGIFGTPHFISPEQAKGKEVDHRADLYSLGATAYRLLSGSTPFQGRNVSEIIHKQVNEEPEPLSKVCPEVPAEIVALVERLMKKDPDERPASAEVLLKEVDDVRLQYHLKARGVGKGGKGVFVALAVAVVAVLGVVGYALFGKKPPPPPIIVNGGSNQPEIGTREPIIEVRDDPELKAKAAFQDIVIDEGHLGELADTWYSRKAEWVVIAERYEEMAGEHEGTTFAGEATGRAKEVREYIVGKERAEETARAEAEAAWLSLKSKVDTALSEGKHSLALSLLEAGVKDEKVARALKILNNAAQQVENWQAAGQGSIRSAFSRRFSEVKRRAADLAKAGKYVEALDALRSFLDLAARGGPEEPFGKAAKAARGLIAKMRQTLEKELNGQLEQDRQLYYKTYREQRHHEDAPGVFEGNPVFDFDFRTASEAFAAIAGAGGEGPGLATEPYRRRARKKAQQLESMQALLDSLVTRIIERRLSSEALELPESVGGGRDAKQEIHWSKTPVATAEGLEVAEKIRIGGSTGLAAKFLRWKSLSATELWKAIFLNGSRWEFSPAEHAAAARFLAETATEEGLAGEIAAAGTALGSEERARLRAELDAIRAWNAVLDSREDKPPEDWHIAGARFVERHHGTDFFILIYGFSGPGDKLLVPESEVNSWRDARLKPLEWE